MIVEPIRFDVSGCAKLLGVPQWQVRRAIRAGNFANPAGNDSQGQPYWHAAGVYRWAVQAMPGLANRIPIDYWPTPSASAAYLGGQEVDSSVIALGWQVPFGRLWVAWDYPSRTDEVLAKAAETLPDAEAFIVVGGDFGHDGPALWAILPGLPDKEKYEFQWSELSRVLGQPVPFWPSPLRIPELLSAWQPGSPKVVAAARTVLDVSLPLRLAAIVEQGSPAQRVLLNLAQTWQSRASVDAEQDLQIVNKATKPETMTVAAVPLQVSRVDLDDLEESVRRAGWLEILGREDNLAAECTRQKVMWDGGADFPSSNPETIDPDDTYGREWAQRLIPAPRTAAIEVLDPRKSALEILVDPETDASAIRGSDGMLHAAIPQRLPASSPLAELILGHPIWVRTQDGILYPAPKNHYFGLSWGYSGSGPGALAVLAHRLLSDINAVAADTVDGAPEGLEKLMRKKWPSGTVLTRAQLVAAQSEL